MLERRGITMRWNVLFLAATLLVAASLPSAAQFRVDMNQITCGGWLGYSPENREFVRFWISGYYNAAANSNILNYNRLQTNSAKVTAYCRKHKSQSLPTAIQNLRIF
jgi:acid stress chaperone HdeB